MREDKCLYNLMGQGNVPGCVAHRVGLNAGRSSLAGLQRRKTAIEIGLEVVDILQADVEPLPSA